MNEENINHDFTQRLRKFYNKGAGHNGFYDGHGASAVLLSKACSYYYYPTCRWAPYE